MHDERSDREKRSREATRALWVGCVLFVIGAMLVLSPLAWGPQFEWNKYFVAFGLIIATLGAGIVLHGGVDWIRSRPR